MGSILQDIEFKLSLIISQNPKETDLKREQTKSSEIERVPKRETD